MVKREPSTPAPHAVVRSKIEFEDGLGGSVTLTPEGLVMLLNAAFWAGMVRFHLNMPKSGQCVANKPVQMWSWIECTATHGRADQYADDDTVYVHVDVDKDAINGDLKEARDG